jgi:pyroglutamyl-peptidase
MSKQLRILITGFGPFPGAPFNPTMPLVTRLTALRRPAFGNVEFSSHIFHVTYATVDRELPELIASLRPDAMLSFGLADRTPFMRIETRARNASRRRFRMPTAIARERARSSMAPVPCCSASRDAGSYLCNYLSWRSIEAVRRANGPHLAAFVHIPLLERGVSSRRVHRITLEELVDASEAMLLEMVKLARTATREVGEVKS